MSIVGHGIDIVETSRIRRMCLEHGQRFLDRCFTPAEQQYASANPKRYYEHLAGRFAAKEAVLKAFGTGVSQRMRFTEVEVVNERSGRPRIVLDGAVAEFARSHGLRQLEVSLTHTDGLALASVVAAWERRP